MIVWGDVGREEEEEEEEEEEDRKGSAAPSELVRRVESLHLVPGPARWISCRSHWRGLAAWHLTCNKNQKAGVGTSN
jgi:hypothetical protein